MQTGDGHVFHLDAPLECPEEGEVRVFGWIVAEDRISELMLVGDRAAALKLVPRPDVEAAFPAYTHVTGFQGCADVGHLRDGALHFSFNLGNSQKTASVALAKAPSPLRGWRRLLTSADAAFARLRLAGSPSAVTRWNAGLRLLLAQARLRRGDALHRATGDAILECFAEAFPRAVVLQIGANDGVAGDPLERLFRKTAWTGVLVEPIPHLADALAAHYAGRQGVVVERAAVAETDGKTRIFRLTHEPGVTPSWFQQLASLDRSVLAKHRTLIPDVESRIVEDVVPSVTVSTLLSRHRLKRVDLLVIDAEGHDFRILDQFDLSSLRPLVVMFEHQHLTLHEKESAYRQLRLGGYRWIETPEGDSLAWRQAIASDAN
jgi:FkbM family methyltransferase